VPSSFAGMPVTNIGDFAFGCKVATEIILPEDLRSIGPNVFYNCTNLKCIDLPESLTFSK
jgi:hypothetical protein